MREFCNEEVVMADTRRMDEEASRIGKEVQETTQRMGREYQKAVERGFETASRSFSEANRGFQALAAEMTDFSKRRSEDVFHAWEQFLGARSIGQLIEIQSEYARKAYDTYTSEMSKLAEIYVATVRNASKPIEQATSRKAV